MKSIFEYIDFRGYLSDYYAFQKKTKRYFSHRYFCKKAGIKSPVFLKLVMEGKRNLTRPMVEKFAVGLGLNRKETDYFSHLVGFNQAKTGSKKQEHYIALKSMSGMVNEHLLGTEFYDYYDKWYISVIRELVCLRDFKDDFKLIGATVLPRITPGQAKYSLNFLISSGLLRKKEDGTYEQTQKAITTGFEVASLAVRNFNRAMLVLAHRSLDSVPRACRHVSGITMGISPDCYRLVITEIEAFKDRVVAIVNADAKSSVVYQLNVQMVPMSINP